MIKKIFPHNILQALALIILSILFTTPIVVLNNHIESQVFNLLCFVSIFTIAIFITIFVNKKNNVEFKFEFDVVKPKILGISILILIFYHLGINKLVSWFFVNFFHLEDGVTSNPSFTLLLGILVFAPILEELFFRGIILKGLLINYNAKKAIFLSVILFALFHGKIIQGTHALFVGGFIAYIYYKENNLTMPIILHFSSNLLGIISMQWKSKQGNIPTLELYGTTTLSIYVLSTISLFLAFWWLLKQTNSTKIIHQNKE